MAGWKTILVSILSLVVYIFGWDGMEAFLQALGVVDTGQVIGVVMGIAMLVLRLITTGPIALFKKR